MPEGSPPDAHLKHQLAETRRIRSPTTAVGADLDLDARDPIRIQTCASIIIHASARQRDTQMTSTGSSWLEPVTAGNRPGMTDRASHRRFRLVALLGAAIVSAIPLSGVSAGATTISHCAYGQLKISEGGGEGATGHIEIPLHFRNKSDRVCEVRAYPGVAGLNKHGKQVEQAKRTRRGFTGGVAPGHKIPTVVLEPGQEATAIVEGTDVPVGHARKCRVLHGLLVTPPNDFKSVHLKHAPPDCSRIQVHPVIRGKDGSQT
jgi:Protein of unknown function (DUF4232)